LQEALTLSKEIGAKEDLKRQYEKLSNLYDTIGRPAQAFEAYKLYIIYRDSIDNEENTKAQTRTEMKYEYEKAELVKEQKEKELARIESEKTSRRDNLQYSIIIIVIVVLSISLLSVRPLGAVRPVVADVLADPYVDRYSGGAPGYKLLFNAGIAALIFPLHAFFEKVLKIRLIKNKRITSQ